MEALAEFETEHDRIRAAEARDLADLIDIVDALVDLEEPDNAHLARAAVVQERAAERLRDTGRPRLELATRLPPAARAAPMTPGSMRAEGAQARRIRRA